MAPQIEFVKDMICINNGVAREPCAVKLHRDRASGKTLLHVKKTDSEWCRLLVDKPKHLRPLAGLCIWKAWDDALLAARRAENIMETDDVDALDGVGDEEDDAPPKRSHTRKQSAVLEIRMPNEPDNRSGHYELVVENRRGKYAFEYKLENVQWLRNYVQKEIHAKNSM